MHAVATDEESSHRPCLYIQLDAGDEEGGLGGGAGGGSSGEEEEEGEELLPELRLIPADASQREAAAAANPCSALIAAAMRAAGLAEAQPRAACNLCHRQRHGCPGWRLRPDGDAAAAVSSCCSRCRSGGDVPGLLRRRGAQPRLQR